MKKSNRKSKSSIPAHLKSQVEVWLKSKKKDHAAGLALLLQTSKDGRIPRELTRNQASGRSLDKMNYLLAQRIGAEYQPIIDKTMPDLKKIKADAKAKAQQAESLERVKAGEVTESDLEILKDFALGKKSDHPLLIQQTIAELENLKKDRAAASDLLTESESDQEIEIVEKIRNIDLSMQAKTSFLAAYFKTGKVPETYQAPDPDGSQDPDANDPSRLTKDIKNLQSKASKIRAALKKDPENQEKLTALKKLDDEIQLLQDQKTLATAPK